MFLVLRSHIRLPFSGSMDGLPVGHLDPEIKLGDHAGKPRMHRSRAWHIDLGKAMPSLLMLEISA